MLFACTAEEGHFSEMSIQFTCIQFTFSRENSLRQHEGETLRGAVLKRETG